MTGWLWIDPVVSLGISAVILIGTWNLFSESLNMVLHAVPNGIDPKSVEVLPGRPSRHHRHS